MAGSQAGVEKVAENDGYMEPYEAQKMMAGKVESTVQGPLRSSIPCCSMNLVATALLLAACSGTRSLRGGQQTQMDGCRGAQLLCSQIFTDLRV